MSTTPTKDPITLWGKALEDLRLGKSQKGSKPREMLSRYMLAKRAGMQPNEYRNLIMRATKGPSVETLDNLLRAMNLTWGDWAKAYEFWQTEERKRLSNRFSQLDSKRNEIEKQKREIRDEMKIHQDKLDELQKLENEIAHRESRQERKGGSRETPKKSYD